MTDRVPSKRIWYLVWFSFAVMMCGCVLYRFTGYGYPLALVGGISLLIILWRALYRD
jgi:hypothetical protein